MGELVGKTVETIPGSCLVKVNEYYRGGPSHQCGLIQLTGKPHQGLTGEETVVTRIGIRPIKTFVVFDPRELKKS